MSETGPKSPGDHTVEECFIRKHNGEEIDIRLIVVGITVFESLYDTVMSGSVSVIDHADLLYEEHIVGGEEMVIVWSQPGVEEIRNHTFRIYKVSDDKPVDEGGRGYVFNVVSEEAFLSLQNKVSTSYDDLISEMASDMFGRLGSSKSFESELTMFPRYYALTFKTPFKHLHWMAERAVSAVHQEANYIFFENRHGFHFKSFTELTKNEENTPFNYRMSITKIRPEGRPNPAEEAMNLLMFKQKKSYDLLESTKEGVFNSRYIGFDIQRKSFYTHDKDLETLWNPSNHNSPVNPYAVDGAVPEFLIGNPQNNRPFHITRYLQDMIYGEPSVDGREDYYQKRMMWVNHLKNFTYEAELYGNLYLTVGTSINIDIPSQRTDDADNQRDNKYISGKYMLTSIKHIFGTEGQDYRIYAEMVKDGIDAGHINE